MPDFAQPPVIVLSPCLRAGTTLLQRLLCSAGNTLIYGDGIGHEMEFFARYAAVKEQMLGFQAAHAAPVRRSVLSGDTDDFITALGPPAADYVDGLRQAALTWLGVCARDAAREGRPVWGWKLAGADAAALAILPQWLPGARWIWIERDLTDCLRSAKAAGMVNGPEEAAQFVRNALSSSSSFLPIREQALVLSYQEMLKDPAGTVCRLEEHTGASGIRSEVFAVKVNTPGFRDCLVPAALTPAEQAAADQAM